VSDETSNGTHLAEGVAEGEKSSVRTLGRMATILIIVVILGTAAGLIHWIRSSEPQARREGATKQTAMLVDVQTVRRGDYTPRIAGLGTVEAAQDIVLSPRVDGRVLEISQNFMPGGFVDKDEVLVKIDPSDYENSVRQRESELRQAKSELDIELGRRDAAKLEYELLNQTLSEENKALVLREPQLESARAAILSAEAALAQARLELERTTIEAPFHAQVLTRNANVGSQVEPGMELARLIGIDEYWVIVTVPVAKLDRIAFPQNGAQGAPVTLRNRTAWPAGVVREGHVSRLIGALDTQTRLARVLVNVSDPLALAETTQGPRLIVGTIVQAEIAGRPLTGVFRIERDYLRKNDTLWVKQDGKLQIRDAVVIFKDKQYAYLTEGLNDGDQLVTSNLATVAEGAPLRIESDHRDRAERINEFTAR